MNPYICTLKVFFLKKETTTEAFSCEFWQILQKRFLIEQLVHPIIDQEKKTLRKGSIPSTVKCNSLQPMRSHMGQEIRTTKETLDA